MLRHCCATPDLVERRTTGGRAECQNYKDWPERGSEKRSYEMWKDKEVWRTEIKMGKKEKKKERRGVEVNLGEWKWDAGSSITEGYFGLHSNDVTSCWHCWTEKQISHLIFAPHFSSSFLLPAHSDNLLGFTTCGSSSFLLSSFVTYLPTLLNVPPLSSAIRVSGIPLPSLCNSSIIGWDQECPPMRQ